MEGFIAINGEKCEDREVAIIGSGLGSPSAMQCEATRVSYGTTKFGRAIDSIVHDGEQANHIPSASLPTSDGFQPAISLPGNGDGVLQHMVTLLPGEGQTREVLRRIGWILEEAKLRSLSADCPIPSHKFFDEYYYIELQRCFEALLYEACQ